MRQQARLGKGGAVLLGLFLLLPACASRPPADDPVAVAYYEEANDPLEPMNRSVYKFNRGVYRFVLDPIATGYTTVMPDPLEVMVRNFLRNLASPIRLINNILQGDAKQAGVTLGRFLTNSTIGAAGLFDPAEDWGMHYRQEDFGQTLAIWGADEGAYVVLPVFGPSSVRDTVGFVGDFLMDPVTWILRDQDLGYLNLARTGMEGLDTYILIRDEWKSLQRESIDPYAAVRSLQRQRRDDLIRNGEPAEREDEEDLFDDFPEFE